MVIAVGDQDGQSIITATDSNNNILTHVERLDELYDQGLHFEASVSQMAVVEALLLFYLKAKVQADGATVSDDIEKLRKNKRLTFGKVKDIVLNNKLIDEESIQTKLKSYVGYRNDLAHNLIASFSSVDLETFYKVGKELIEFFHIYLLSIIKRQKG